MIRFIQSYTTKSMPPESFEAGQEVERSPESELYLVRLGVAGFLHDGVLVDQDYQPIVVETAASLEATFAAIGGLARGTTPGNSTASVDSILNAAATSQAASTPAAANDGLVAEVRALRSEVEQLRNDNNTGHAATASNTGRVAKRLDDVTAESGGQAITVASVAA